MTKMRVLSALAALAVLGACATATPYQAATDSSRGYTNQQIESNRWLIGFSGNSLTDRQTVETYLLYRAAELTKQQGFDHFKFVKRDTEANSRIVPTGHGGYHSSFYGSPFFCDYRFYSRRGRLRGFPRGFYGPSYAYHDPFWGGGYDYREIVRYDATSEIIMGKGDKPADTAYFNAAEVQVNLANRIVRPEAS